MAVPYVACPFSTARKKGGGFVLVWASIEFFFNMKVEKEGG